MIVKFHPRKHRFRNGESNAFVHTNTKNTRTAVADRVLFLLIEAPAPIPGEQKCSESLFFSAQKDSAEWMLAFIKSVS